MKLTEGVEWAVHCCVVLSQAEGPVSTTRLAEFHGVSRTYLAKHLQQLSRAGLVRSTPGRDGGYELTRPAAEVTLLEIVQAVDGAESAFRCTEIRQRGPLAASKEVCRKACGVAQAMAAAERAWRTSLAGVTVADLAAGVTADVGPATFDRLRGWLADA
ncbi:Rrf2 family transcriptional regulator [Nocardioides marmoriginsengisoli]|uniref:Rrf2 family transcriptional regulator n=1 Tax=Nocardioides marmoriginsengisoli TaxID=661483 RepID=A0A3N0CHJ2_9ACTN|nr:Rrf2 family transcriptional regulator [Nocardioides marmoriginsengisoli]RNL62924.1 Rrf2 family transcriptional regulator [Nocardioides marmoriginsengisoli]